MHVGPVDLPLRLRLPRGPPRGREQARAGAPLAFATGQRTLSLAAAARVELAARAASVSANDFCGADKPMLTVDVTSPAGTRTYTDSFYSCMGGDHVFVDGLDAVVSALRDATR